MAGLTEGREYGHFTRGCVCTSVFRELRRGSQKRIGWREEGAEGVLESQGSQRIRLAATLLVGRSCGREAPDGDGVDSCPGGN